MHGGMMSMKNRYNKLIVIFLIGIVIAGVGFWIRNDDLKALDKLNQLKDTSEINYMMDKAYCCYRSETGFGNDRFDIYIFSLKKDDYAENDFILCDELFEEKFTYNFMSMANAYGQSDEGVRKIRADIKKLRKKKDLRYKYVNLGGTEKMYIYSKRLNKGYCMIITISHEIYYILS